ncbi:MAG: aminotransferase class I/II-fold pyridoxal phosphate-dependent enzyme [Clostridia bacterium]|nr:aminotransferase class I/II-fold pyridoxal phosphate-dependent enzyme [Clostridia bacterium]
MQTPVYDFVKTYAKSKAIRLHMPGHKGKGKLGVEPFDVTEITGADSLYEAKSIIFQSEKNASELFGANTFYSTEGSSQCIRAMLFLASRFAKTENKKLKILAARNVHKTFLSGVALLGLEVEWLYGKKENGYLRCEITAEQLENALAKGGKDGFCAVYLTSPDYLGNRQDIQKMSAVCRKFGVLLLVDNAHGAYLKFLSKSEHPIDLGADICCDSAHKTLGVLTGGAYLHLNKNLPKSLCQQAKSGLSLFGSTSPSYLILTSLDLANRELANAYPKRLKRVLEQMEKSQKNLRDSGYEFVGNEPLKWTLDCKKYGYLGTEIAEKLQKKGVFCEFADRDYLVLMFSANNKKTEIKRVENLLESIERRRAIKQDPPAVFEAERGMEIRESVFSESEEIAVKNAVGRILATPSVSCPPAVPILACGETIDERAIETFSYYGVERVRVVKEK